MSIVAGYAVEMQSTRKILTIVDASTGWNQPGSMLDTFFKWNTYNNHVYLEVNIETKNKTYTKRFALTAPANDDIPDVSTIFGTTAHFITDVAELRCLVALSLTGNLVLVTADTDVDGYLCLPDGIYTVNYIIHNNSDVPTSTSTNTFVVTNGGEQTVLNAANKIADEILVCTKPNIGNISDYLFQEALLFAANKAAMISRKDRILNILSAINS